MDIKKLKAAYAPIKLTVTDVVRGTERTEEMPLATYFQFLYLIKTVGQRYTADLAIAGVEVASERQVTANEMLRVEAVLSAIQQHAETLEDPEEWILKYSYDSLRAKTMDRAHAAFVASALLNKPIKTDAWRKAVDRWAEKNDLPKVEIHRRSKVKTDN